MGLVGKDGGFIPAESHSIHADTPAEDVVAMFGTARS
jgi:hypothetical protein